MAFAKIIEFLFPGPYLVWKLNKIFKEYEETVGQGNLEDPGDLEGLKNQEEQEILKQRARMYLGIIVLKIRARLKRIKAEVRVSKTEGVSFWSNMDETSLELNKVLSLLKEGKLQASLEKLEKLVPPENNKEIRKKLREVKSIIKNLDS